MLTFRFIFWIAISLVTSTACRKAASAVAEVVDAGVTTESQRVADLAALPRGASLPEQLAAESAARPKNGLTIEQVVSEAGLALAQTPSLGRTYRALFCGQAAAAGVLQVVVCEYADREHAARGVSDLSRVFSQMAGGSVTQVGPSALVLVAMGEEGERAAERIRQKFLKSN